MLMFRFSRFLQQSFGNDSETPMTISKAVSEDKDLRDSYAKIIGYSAKLTNPRMFASLLDLLEANPGSPRGDMRILPPATSRHAELFARLFPLGLPPNTDMMRELIRAIRSTKVSLEPQRDSGWFDYQVFALETLLLPEKSPESAKLLLTKSYKKRMLDAFKALVTKRIETHVRDVGEAKSEAPMLIDRPRLRIEPCPSYYLRTARAYGFLKSFLDSEISRSELAKLHGLRGREVRTTDLAAEIESMRYLFYGFYLVSCEDIGLKPALSKEETPDPKTCRGLALAWIQNWKTDSDLAVDTRASIPIYTDRGRNITQLWASLGVRLGKLETSYAHPPSSRFKSEDIWIEGSSGPPVDYLIPIDEFAEVELPGDRVLTRDELRATCNRHKTKEAIVKALRSSK